MSKKIGAKRALIGVIAVDSITLALTVAFVHTKEHAGKAPLMALGFGGAIGATYLVQKIFFLSIIPAGQEAELQGIYSFMSNVIQWAPQVLFSYLNTVYNSARWGLAAFGIFYFLAAAVFSTVEVKKAKKDAAKSREEFRKVFNNKNNSTVAPEECSD
tara:strand:- start:516 stop:989 length:474 start_codon:yes stop_codon:yes gene_type:complete